MQLEGIIKYIDDVEVKMLYAALPKAEKKTLEYPHFPTIQQVIVWRNWGLVPVNRIAEVEKNNQNH